MKLKYQQNSVILLNEIPTRCLRLNAKSQFQKFPLPSGQEINKRLLNGDRIYSSTKSKSLMSFQTAISIPEWHPIHKVRS